MPTAADTATPPAAPAAAPAAAAPAAPAAPATPAGDELDPTLRVLFESAESETPAATANERGRTLEQAMQPDDPAAEPTKKEGEGEPKKKEGDTPAAAAPAAPATEDKPIRGRKKPAPEPAVAPTPTPDAPPATPAAATPAAPADELAGVELMDSERESLELARYAEAKDPTKHAGLVAKVTKYIKDHAKFIEDERKADPDAVFDANNTRYQAFLAKNRPPISTADARTLERERITDDAKKQMSPELEKMKDELYRRDAEPEVRKEGDKFVASVLNEAAPEALAKCIRDEGLAKAKEKFPFEFSVVEEVAGAATADIEEFIRLTKLNPDTGRTLRSYDAKNSQHARIVAFVDQLCAGFKANGGAATVVNGKKFLTRAEFYRLKPEQQTPYWTFSNEDVVKRANGVVKTVIRERITAEEKRLEGLGFKRNAAAPVVPPAPAPAPAGAPPAPRSAPSAPSDGTPPPEDAQGLKYKNILLGE